jgi:hypothetical protein
MALHVMWEGVGQSNRKRRGAVIGRRRQQLGLGLKKGPKSAGSPTQDQPLSTPRRHPSRSTEGGGPESRRRPGSHRAVCDSTRQSSHPSHNDHVNSNQTPIA